MWALLGRDLVCYPFGMYAQRDTIPALDGVRALAALAVVHGGVRYRGHKDMDAHHSGRPIDRFSSFDLSDFD